MKHILLLIIMLFVAIPLNAQKQGQELIDSLLSELPKAKEDTNKVNLLSILSYSYYIISPDEGIKFANQGIELAKKLDWKKGLAKNYNSLFQNFWSKGDFDMAVENYNEGVKIEEALGMHKPIAGVLKNINRTFTYPTSEYTALTGGIRTYLDEVVKFMKKNTKVIISIIGHSDNFGTLSQNTSRALKRAQNVRDYMTKRGIARRRLLAQGKGSINPRAKNDTEAGRRKNRRVVIRMLKTSK